MSLPGARLVDMICRSMEVRPKLLILVQCPYCNEQEAMELDPRDSLYWCRNCSKAGRLEALERHVEAEFVARHRQMTRLMETPPGVERGGGLVPVCKRGRREQK